ncbi:sugar ABC transporter ATP-binding protein [Bauldia litoralis]|uniref:sugar ABC transporter ATP-binding protein n=1 Tax=Bauldia litoralis TaxID=665467 RepID=UPI0032635BEE
MEPLLEARGLTKAFAGVVAVDSLDLTILPGEVVALVGENGAGKSTVIKMISGQYAPDAGALHFEGRPVTFKAPVEARDAGIAVIHQELQLVPQMSVAENIVLGRWPRGGAGVDFDRARKIATEILPTIGFHVSVDTPVDRLSTGQQQLVEIGRALAFQSRLLILDEPTASLSNSEAERLMELVRDLRSRGIGILYVSHRMEEIFRLSDRITVMRDGKLVGVKPRSELDHDQVVAMMVGDQKSLHVHRQHKRGDLLLSTRGLTRRGVFEDISIDVHRGEVVGLAGLVGAGRTEVARCIFGLEPPDSGSIEVDGQPVRISNPHDAISRGFALVPEDRKAQGLVLIASVAANLTLSALRKISRSGVLSRSAEDELVRDYVGKLGIKTASTKQAVENLSGGNQQKVVLSRWLATNPKLMILDEPTRGVDVGAKAEIHRVIEELVGQGLGVLLISSELPELIAMSDRVYVMRAGRIDAELGEADIEEQTIMRFAAGAERQ